MGNRKYSAVILGFTIIASGLVGYFVLSGQPGEHDISSTTLTTGELTDAPTPKDVVTVTIHDKEGNLIGTHTTNNIVTTAGAAFYCIETGLCLGGATGAIESPTVSYLSTLPIYWVGFVNGSAANTNEPTAADCSVSSSNELSGQVSGSKCVVNFGSAPAQYPSGSNNFVATLCQSATSCTGQLRASSATIDASNIYVKTTQLFNGCSPNSNGTAPASGTCVNAQQTAVFSNNISQKLVISGLVLVGGDKSATAAGPLIVAEASLSPSVSLNPGDTIQVTWQLTI